MVFIVGARVSWMLARINLEWTKFIVVEWLRQEISWRWRWSHLNRIFQGYNQLTSSLSYFFKVLLSFLQIFLRNFSSSIFFLPLLSSLYALRVWIKWVPNPKLETKMETFNKITRECLITNCIVIFPWETYHLQHSFICKFLFSLFTTIYAFHYTSTELSTLLLLMLF